MLTFSANGFVSLSIFSAAALVLWYGITLVRTEQFSPGTVILVCAFLIFDRVFCIAEFHECYICKYVKYK